jgi:hypothetical protein
MVFNLSDNYRPGQGCSGLGLYIAKGIADARGSLIVASEGAGNDFHNKSAATQSARFSTAEMRRIETFELRVCLEI